MHWSGRFVAACRSKVVANRHLQLLSKALTFSPSSYLSLAGTVRASWARTGRPPLMLRGPCRLSIAFATPSAMSGMPSSKLSNHSRIPSATNLRSQVATSGTHLNETFHVKTSFRLSPPGVAVAGKDSEALVSDWSVTHSAAKEWSCLVLTAAHRFLDPLVLSPAVW